MSLVPIASLALTIGNSEVVFSRPSGSSYLSLSSQSVTSLQTCRAGWRAPGLVTGAV